MVSEPIIYIVDDDPDVRNFLMQLVQSSGYKAKSYDHAQTFLNEFTDDQHGCLLLDVRMPDLTGPGLQDKLVEKGMDIPIIMMTGYGDVPTAVRAIQKGAIDFIEKPLDSERLLDRIRQALEIDITQRKLRKRKNEFLSLFARLTTREREVMELVVSGKANKQVAVDLGISPKTVEIHRAHVMQKIQVDSLAELVRAAHISGAINDDLS